MEISEAKLQKILTVLQSKGIIKKVNRVIAFNDDPKPFQYAITPGSNKKFSDGVNHGNIASGLSFKSPKIALLKCLGEAMERFSLVCFREKDILHMSYQELILDSDVYEVEGKARNKKIGWVLGFNLTNNLKSYLPAQLLYLNYQHQGEPIISFNVTSSGAAGGFDHESTLLRGIYELIERDAFMASFLLKLRPRKQINLHNLKDNQIKKMVKLSKKYNLEIKVFEITSDLEIPSFLTLVVDKTGLGPAISAGLRASLNSLYAITASIEEAFLSRVHTRVDLHKSHGKKTNSDFKKINTFEQRGQLWSPLNMLPNLHFLFSAKSENLEVSKEKIGPKKELQIILGILKKHQKKVFYADLTLPLFKSLDYRIYKVLIPKLQPFYLRESAREFDKKRLNEVALNQGMKVSKINPIPHFFQ